MNVIPCMMLSDGTDTPPAWIRVAPYGHWVHPRSGPFEMTPESAQQMVANALHMGIDTVVDFEHQTLRGVKAPAAGWIKELQARDDGLWAQVDWTDEARDLIQAKQYRYYSPVFDFDGQDPKSGKRIGAVLHSIGLTNTPLLADDIQPLAAKASSTDTGETDMELKELVKLLGLPEDATEEVVAAKVDELEAIIDLKLATKGVLGLLNLPEDATEEDVAAKIVALKAEPEGDDGDDGGEQQSEVDDLQKKVAELEGRESLREAETLVGEAIAAKRIMPSQREWAISYAQRDPADFATFVASQPVLLAAKAVAPPGGDGKPALTADELAVCKRLGTDPEKYAALKAADALGNPDEG